LRRLSYKYLYLFGGLPGTINDGIGTPFGLGHFIIDHAVGTKLQGLGIVSKDPQISGNPCTVLSGVAIYHDGLIGGQRLQISIQFQVRTWSILNGSFDVTRIQVFVIGPVVDDIVVIQVVINLRIGNGSCTKTLSQNVFPLGIKNLLSGLKSCIQRGSSVSSPLGETSDTKSLIVAVLADHLSNGSAHALIPKAMEYTSL